MEERLLPSALDAEEACLGAMMVDPRAIHEISGFLEPEDFYLETNREIYSAMLTLADKNAAIDFVTIAAELEHREMLDEIGGQAYIIGLVGAAAYTYSVETYAKIIHSRATSRKIIHAASAIANLAYDEEDSDKALDMAEQLIYGIRSNNGLDAKKGPVKVAAAEYIDRVEALSELDGGLAGLPTGFKDMDRLLGGLPNSDLIIVAARPSMGKTALMLQMATHNAMKMNKMVGVFSLEMSAEQLMQRMASTMTGIDSMRLRRGAVDEGEWPKFYRIMGEISESGLLIDDTPGMSPGQVRSRSRQWASRYGLDMIVVDYMQLMSVEGKQSRVQEVSAIGKGLKNLARELDIPVVVGSQLNRAVESRGNKRPQLSDLRDSGTIEEDGDIIAFIYRDDYYNTETSEKPNIAEISISKNRNGPPGIVELYWQAPLATFRDLQIVNLNEPVTYRPPPPKEKEKVRAQQTDWTEKFN